MRRVHHRGDVCLAGVPSRRSRRANRQAPSLGRAVSRARASRGCLFARQGAAVDRAAAQRRLCGAGLSARRHGEDHRLLRQPRHCARRAARGARRQQSRARRHHHHLSAIGAQRYLDAAVSRADRRLCLGLDAGAGTGAPARRRAAAGRFRPRGLGRPHRDDRRDRRRRNLGHPRPGGRAGALVHHPRPESAAARYCRLRDEDRRADEDDSGEAEG